MLLSYSHSRRARKRLLHALAALGLWLVEPREGSRWRRWRSLLVDQLLALLEEEAEP